MSEDFLSLTGVTKHFGAVAALDGASLSVPHGRALALLGPSGCGKTTLLRAIAGLERIDAGRIAIDGCPLSDGRTFVPAERRRVGMVFQDWALFPHLSVARNVAYGLSRRDVAAGRVAEALDLVRLGHLADRKPHELSGGQAQRVALARALAPRPRILLFDEPFASLDTELRVAVRTEVASLLRDLDVTSVFVTHDQEEAFVLGDSVAVMRDGVVQQCGRPADIYARPVSPWVAGFVGEANLLAGEVSGSVATTTIGPVSLAGPATRHGSADVLVRPEHVSITAGSLGWVEGVEFYGHDTSYRVRVHDRHLLVRVLAAPAFAVGDTVDLRYSGPATVAYTSTAPTGTAEPSPLARHDMPVMAASVM